MSSSSIAKDRYHYNTEQGILIQSVTSHGNDRHDPTASSYRSYHNAPSSRDNRYTGIGSSSSIQGSNNGYVYSSEQDSLLSKSDMVYDDHPMVEATAISPMNLSSWWPFSSGHSLLSRKLWLAILALFIFLFAFSHLLYRRRFTGDRSRFGMGHSKKSLIKFSVTVSPYDSISSLGYLPWDAIIEPYKLNNANITSVFMKGRTVIFSHKTLNGHSNDGRFRNSKDLEDVTVIWNIDGVEYVGSDVSFQVNRTGLVPFSVTVLDDSGPTIQETFSVASKYVRREIRTLTDEDREAALSALHIMYTTSSRVGALTYGSSFRSGEQLVYKHLTAAGTTDCDHWHDGPGIVTNHAAFTLEAERSMQSINPAISMPYWEYPMDAFYYTDENWGESPIFRDDWFGVASPNDLQHELKEGRFADVFVSKASNVLTAVENENTAWDQLATGSGSLNPYVNAYGQLRSPWNSNPAHHISRLNTTYGIFSKLGRPGCASMSSCYASKSFGQMSDCLNGYTHGPVHIFIGGSWGEGDIFDDNKEINLKFIQKASKMLLFKMLWRYGWARCPTSCDSPDSGSQRRLGGAGPLGNSPPVGGVGIGGAIPSPTGKGPPILDGTLPPSLGPASVSDGPPLIEKTTPKSDDEYDDDDSDIEPPPLEERKCSCHVPKEYIEEYGAEYILTSAGVLDAISRDLAYIPAFPDMDLFYFSLLHAIQDPGIVGDMLTSAAPQDPIFWPLHGSIERLLGLKRISLQMGLINEKDFDLTWGYETDNLLYLRGKCDWSKVDGQDDLTLPTCTMGADILCEGHNEDDVLHFQHLLKDDRTFTNKQMLDLLHPWNDELPYTYDSFDYDYCYDFYPDSRTGSVASSSTAGRFTFQSLKYPTAAASTANGKYTSTSSGGAAMG